MKAISWALPLGQVKLTYCLLDHWKLMSVSVNSLRPRQNGRHFPDNIFICIFLNEIVWISIKISLKFVPRGQMNNIPALVQLMVGAYQATSHYLNQWWFDYWSTYASLGLNELIKLKLQESPYKKMKLIIASADGGHFVSTSISTSMIVWRIRIKRHCLTLSISYTIDPRDMRPSATYMRQWIGSALVKIVPCRLFGAKPSSELMLEYC